MIHQDEARRTSRQADAQWLTATADENGDTLIHPAGGLARSYGLIISAGIVTAPKIPDGSTSTTTATGLLA